MRQTIINKTIVYSTSDNLHKICSCDHDSLANGRRSPRLNRPFYVSSEKHLLFAVVSSSAKSFIRDDDRSNYSIILFTDPMAFEQQRSGVLAA